MLSKIAPRYWALTCLLAWAAVILGFGLLRPDAVGIDEGAAQALLLNWYIPSATSLGGPDFRTLLFFPLGLYWPDSILAAKVYTLLFVFAGCWMLYQWQRENADNESALLATGLMLIAPVTLLQIDSLGAGPILLCIFGWGHLLDRKYRSSPHQISSWYFIQLLLIAGICTLHPIGLAYPLALAWQWQQDPKSARQKKMVWTGMASAMLIVAVMHTGWIDLHWLSNPLTALSDATIGLNPANADPSRGAWGLLPILLLLIVGITYIRQGTKSLLGNMLLLASLAGFFVADLAWAYIVSAFILYLGIPQLIALNDRFARGGFAGHRGILLILLILTTTSFMQTNRSYASYIDSGLLSPTDDLIEYLADIIEKKDVEIPIVASQWPARTMIACKCDVLKLPPASPTGSELLPMIKGVTHLVFNHNDPHNSALARNFSEITSKTETLAMLEGGVVIKIRGQKAAPATSPHGTTGAEDNKTPAAPQP